MLPISQSPNSNSNPSDLGPWDCHCQHISSDASGLYTTHTASSAAPASACRSRPQTGLRKGRWDRAVLYCPDRFSPLPCTPTNRVWKTTRWHAAKWTGGETATDAILRPTSRNPKSRKACLISGLLATGKQLFKRDSPRAIGFLIRIRAHRCG